MKKVLSTLISVSMMATSTVAISAVSASALTLTGNVSCDPSEVTGATACLGAYSGNDSNQDLSGLFNISDWTEVAKVDMSDAGVGGNDGILTVGNGSTTGSWSVSSAPSSPFMIVLKGGPTFSAYLMDGSVTSGSWFTTGIEKGNGKAGPDLSHLTVYEAVPEPLTILGAGAAISFGTAFKRKLGKGKKNDKKA